MTRQSPKATKRTAEGVIAIAVGAVLLRSAMFHIENPYAYLSSIYGYRITGAGLGAVLAATLPFLQLSLGIVLIFAPHARAVALNWSVALFSIFVGLQLLTYLRGIDVSCGCFSAANDAPIGAASIAVAASCAIAAGFGRFLSDRNGPAAHAQPCHGDEGEAFAATPETAFSQN